MYSNKTPIIENIHQSIDYHITVKINNITVHYIHQNITQ